MRFFKFTFLRQAVNFSYSTIEAATVTIVATTTDTIVDPNAPIASSSHLLRYPYGNVAGFCCLLLLGIPIVWWLARQQKAKLSAQQPRNLKQAVKDDWEQPWRTKDWSALYGLIGLANDNQWEHTPFWFYKSIHKRWHQPNRPWMKRLLALGVIPLFISDGGIDTHQINFTNWGWQKGFPYVKWPKYQQGKKRAFFEFLVPFPLEVERKQEFLEVLINNRGGEGEVVNNRVYSTDKINGQPVNDNSYGVTVRFGPPDRGAIYYSIRNPPEPEERPFEVGAQAPLEFLLPFKRDKVLKRGYGARSNRLAFFVKHNEPEKVPLLRHAETVIVRLEARHYAVCELDRFVFHTAQEVGLAVEWPEDACRKAALRELKRCKLPVDGLEPFVLSEPERYH